MEINKIKIGVAPVKRSFLSVKEAIHQKNRFMKVISSIDAEAVELIDIDDVVENGIAFTTANAMAAIEKFRKAGIEALFIPFCDFGEETVAAEIAAAFHLPTLIWGSRDEQPNTDAVRWRDTQCGMFAATKVLQRYGITYSYIFNCDTEDPAFAVGFDKFVRVAAVLRDLRTLRIAKMGDRPSPFMSVQTNEANLIKRIGAVVVPVSPVQINKRADDLVKEKGEQLIHYYEDIKARLDTRATPDEQVLLTAAIKIATKEAMEKAGCSVAAFECWPFYGPFRRFVPCLILGELADEGMPLACETDINGAITLAILRACTLYETSPFLADLTIRNPQDDNSELLWHCGPFPYSLKNPETKASLVAGQERFDLRGGHLSLCRFDEINDEYYLFAGEADTTTGPKTNGTYVYIKTDNWKRWEEKLMFGPYIHHLGGAYGSYKDVLREVARYLKLNFDDPDEQGIHSL